MRRVLRTTLGLFLLVLLPLASVAAVPRVLDRAQLRVVAHIPPLALVEITRGQEITIDYDGSSEGVLLPNALAFQVAANAPWQADVLSASPFELKIKPAGSRAAPAAVVAGEAGQHATRWDVVVQVPPGTPAGRYQVPLTLLVSAVGSSR